jgi:hypothetical protein
MKIIKNRDTGELRKFSNLIEERVRQDILIGKETGIVSRFVFSTKGAWKRSQNSIKKQAAINRRAYVKRRRILKQRYLGGDKSVRIVNPEVYEAKQYLKSKGVDIESFIKKGVNEIEAVKKRLAS